MQARSVPWISLIPFHPLRFITSHSLSIMATEMSTHAPGRKKSSSPPSPPPPLYVEYSQSPLPIRPMECTTEARFLETLFLYSDNARDNHMLQLVTVLTDLPHTTNVVRSMNIKVDMYDPSLFPPTQHQLNRSGRPLPPWRQLSGRHYRVVTSFTAIGRTSLKLQHRFLTVPESQLKRNFNNREEDAKYQQLQEGDEPERQFASVEGGLVFIKWQEGENGRFFFKPYQCPFQDQALVKPSVAQMLREQGPVQRPAGSARPENAFKVEVYLRKSDEDEFGHVTNSRYAALVYDALTYGVRMGYYANGSGSCQTSLPLPTDASQPLRADRTSDIAVPAGIKFYEDFNVHELFVGYMNELKVKPGVFVWSWVERDRIQGHLDVIQLEICSEDRPGGKERVLSLCRAIVGEYQRPAEKASL